MPSMRVRHFVPKERLTKDWLFNRLYFQGVSTALTQPSLMHKGALLGKTCLRLLLRSILLWLIPGRDAFRERCYLKMAQGTLDGLLGRVS